MSKDKRHLTDAWAYRTMRYSRADRSRIRDRDLHDEFDREVSEALQALGHDPDSENTTREEA